MKFVGVREAQANLSGLVEQSQKERIVLTRHGQPIAVLTGVEGKDLEDFLLGQDPEFRKLIADRRSYDGPMPSHDSLVRESGGEARGASRGKKPAVRKRRRKNNPP